MAQINEYVLLMMGQNWHIRLVQRFFLLWVREINAADHLMVSLLVWEIFVHDVLVLSGVLDMIKSKIKVCPALQMAELGFP